ncbi:MAG: dihydroorotase [Oligoflexia bacterium]|nr:dihydroorotase [Oligoflexia bacterium]
MMNLRALPSKFVIKNCTLWTDQIYKTPVDIVIINGIVEEIVPTGQKFHDFEVISPKNGLITQLGVDVQAHLRVPGQSQKETPETGLKAALHGGYKALLTMPNTNPVIDSVDVCNLAKEQLNLMSQKYGVEVYLSAAMTKSQAGQIPVDGKSLSQWGVKALTDDGKGLASDAVMEELFKISETTSLPLLQHAEFPGHGGVLAPGPVQEKLKLKPYYADAEVDMVKRDLKLLSKYKKARYHVLHVSSQNTVEEIAKAKKQGLNATCEVCPHHLLFTSEDINENDSSFKMNPPLRSKSDREALRQALSLGVIDFVSTDHAPHEASMKTTDFSSAAFGTTGLEAALRVVLSLESQKVLTPQRVVEVFSQKPSEFLNIQKSIKKIKKGEPFEAVLLENYNNSFEFNKNDLESLSQNSCFLGAKLNGKINYVFNSKGVWEFTN